MKDEEIENRMRKFVNYLMKESSEKKSTKEIVDTALKKAGLLT